MPRMTTALLCSPPFCLSALRNWFIDTSKTAFLPVWTLTSMLLRTNKSTDDGIYTALHSVFTHLETENSNIRLFNFLFQFSIQDQLAHQHCGVGLPHSTINYWIFSQTDSRWKKTRTSMVNAWPRKGRFYSR